MYSGEMSACKLKIIKGSTKRFKFAFEDQADLSTAQQITLTIKPDVTADDDEIIIQKEYDEELSDLANGIICFKFLPEDTRELEAESYLYDVQITFDSETVYIPAVGMFIIYNNVWFRT